MRTAIKSQITFFWSYLPLSNDKFSQTYNGDNVVQTIATSFLIQSLSILQVTRTAIKSRMNSTSSHIRLFMSELLALECWKAHFWPCPIDSAFNFDQIFIKLAGNQDSHKFSDEFADISLRSYLSLRAEKAHIWPCPIKCLHFDRSSLNLQVARTAINSQMSSNFSQIRLLTSGLLVLQCRKLAPIYL